MPGGIGKMEKDTESTLTLGKPSTTPPASVSVKVQEGNELLSCKKEGRKTEKTKEK